MHRGRVNSMVQYLLKLGKPQGVILGILLWKTGCSYMWCPSQMSIDFAGGEKQFQIQKEKVAPVARPDWRHRRNF